MSYVQLMNNARFCMNSKCWYLVIISLFYSCNKEPVEDPLKDFTSNQTVKLEYSRKIDLEQYGVLKPASILKCTDGYMISSQTNKAMFSRIYLDENRVITGVDKGNAPGELISPSSIQQMNGHVYVYDIGRKTIFEIQENLKDSLLTLSRYRTLEMDSRPFLINLLPNGHILASGIFHNSWVSYFDRENEMVSCLPFPTFDETDMLSDVSLSVLYLSTFTSVKPDGKKMVCATQTCGVLSFCTITPNAITISKQIKYYPEILEDAAVLNVHKAPYPYTVNFRPTKMDIVKDKKIFLGAFKEGRFGVIDSTNTMVDCPAEYPFECGEVTGIYRGNVFQGCIEANNKQGKFVIATYSSDIFEIYQVTDSAIQRLYVNKFCNAPKVRKKGGQYVIDFNKSIVGLKNMAVSDDLICFTYSSALESEANQSDKSSNEILCFDWNGKKVKKIILPISVNKFCMDDQYIYGVKYDEDETAIYRFKFQ